VKAISGGSKTSRVWCTANFFFSEETLAQGDIGKVYALVDQWLMPEGTGSPAPSLPPPPPPSPAAVPVVAPTAGKAIDLKPGMTRDEIVAAMGLPVQESGFGERLWMTYPGMTLSLEQGKLTSVERNAQALVPITIHSDPDGADVFLDGSFVSSTPAVLRLPAGSYKVVVKMSGFADWEREVKVLPGAEVNLKAKLTK